MYLLDTIASYIHLIHYNFYSPGSWDTSKVTSDQLFRIFFLIHEAAVLEPETQVRGVVVIMDFDGLSMKQVMALSPSFSMRLLGFIQDAMPLRLKEVHMVKQPFIFKMVWKIFSPFIREKLKSRVSFRAVTDINTFTGQVLYFFA